LDLASFEVRLGEHGVQEWTVASGAEQARRIPTEEVPTIRHEESRCRFSVPVRQLSRHLIRVPETAEPRRLVMAARGPPPDDRETRHPSVLVMGTASWAGSPSAALQTAQVYVDADNRFETTAVDSPEETTANNDMTTDLTQLPSQIAKCPK
jgi:hypothetical protein